MSEIHPRAIALFEELLMVADDLITVNTATLLAQELGITNFDALDYDH